MKPKLYLFAGYPGAGKTTIAHIIQQATGAEHIWADLARHEMFREPTHSREESQQLYAHLNQLAEDYLRAGKSVIYDTNFNYVKDREHMRQLAAQYNAEPILIWVTTPKDIARERATKQSQAKVTRIWGNMPLEAFERISSHLQPPQADEPAIQIDSSTSTEASIKQALGL